MRMGNWILGVGAAAVVALWAGLAPAQVEAPTPDGVARAFAEAVVAGGGAAARALGTAEMVTAMTDVAIAQLMGAVTAQAGEITAVGEARHDDNVDGYRRYRVPVVGAKATIDFQVVIDADLRVAGLGLLPHAPEAAPGAEGAAVAPREIDVAVGPADSALPGTLSLPDGDGPFPAVVLVHGSGPNDRDETIMGNRPFRDIAHGLAARGVAVLRYDKRSLTNPQSLMAHGAALTVQHEVIDDAVAAVALLRGRAEIDPARVFVLGHSLGGMVGPRIVKQAKADGMIIMAGAARSLPDMMVEQTDYIVALDDTVTAEEAAQAAKMKEAVAALRAAQRDPAKATTSQLGAPIGYYTDLEAHDGPAEAAALDMPIFVLQGGRDYQVTEEDFAKWQQSLSVRPGACLKFYPDLDHLMRTGDAKSSPEDYAVPRLVAPVVIDDIATFVLKGCNSLQN